MTGETRSDAKRSGNSRLVYGWSGEHHYGARRTALAIAAARHVDQVLGRWHLARPVVLVSGFWRSGTTWLQECFAAALGGKTVFEPLSPMEPVRRAAMMALYPRDSEDLLQATIPGPQASDAALWRYLDRTCSGRLATSYLLSCRQDVAESFRRAIVVKDVRLQANLAAFHRRYRVPIVHVRRHPCAVVASLKAADWHWSLARAELSTLLPRLAPALAPAELAIALRFDTDRVARTAALWAVTEKLAARALARQAWGAMLSYETFAAAPDAILGMLCASLGLKSRRRIDASVPSASIDPGTFAAYGAPPLDRWRHSLPAAEIGAIEAVADAVYPDWRAALPHP